ncbi:MAG: ASKHA domain-containing protein, partial [Deltaproteobacteria bacterium]
MTVPPPAMNLVVADRERLLLALKETHDLKHVSIDPHMLRKLPGALRAERGSVTLTLNPKRKIVDINAGDGAGLFGIAFDLGSTTVVAFLIDLTNGHMISVRAALNPQINHGDDVITRISFCNETKDGLQTLRGMVVNCLNTLIAETAGEVGISPDQILEATLVGNTAMHHLFMGMDPKYLAMAPYTPVLQDSQNLDAQALSLDIGPSANVHLLPLKAGFVGSDTIACILATGLHRSKSLTLLIDLGTNGEIVFGNRDRMVCCSTAAGPAFEGGHLRWGMRASPGAIERVRIDADILDVTWKTIGQNKPVGICGSGVISAVAEMIRAGIILARGNFDQDIQTDRLRDGEDGLEFILARASETNVGQDVVITQRDVSELQMAKSAIHAGSTLLMEQWKNG